MDDLADGIHGMIALGAALITHEVQLHVSGLAVTALHARGGDHVAPEVVHMLHVLGVRLEFGDQGPVVLTCALVQRSLSDEHHHGDAVGRGLLELRTHPLGGDDGGRVLRRH